MRRRSAMREPTRSATSRRPAPTAAATGGSGRDRCAFPTCRAWACRSPRPQQSGGPRRAWPMPEAASGQWGFAVETSRGKDTPSGHWEIAGVPVTFDWGYFPRTIPCLPKALTRGADRATAVCRGFSATGMPPAPRSSPNSAKSTCAAASRSSTLRPISSSRSPRTRRPSGSSASRSLPDRAQPRRRSHYRTGHRAAVHRRRPGKLRRTGNRRDFAMPPPQPTLLDRLTAAGREVRSIGKIGDIFAGRGTGAVIKASGHDALFERTIEAAESLAAGGLAFVNFVDFDSALWPPPRRGGLCGGPRTLRRAAARAASRISGQATSRSSPPIMAAIRPGPAAITPANACRCWRSDRTSRRGPSAGARPSPISARPWPASSASDRSPTAPPGRCDHAVCFPSPLWGGIKGGGHTGAATRPPPWPSPQGGGESSIGRARAPSCARWDCWDVRAR